MNCLLKSLKAMEGLHVLTYKAVTMGLFKGVSVGNDRLNISHLIYADDVIFLGIGVSDEEVSNMANVIGCEAAKFPLKYLGVPVGCNMARCSNWNDILGNLACFLLEIRREKDVLGEMEEMLSEQRFGRSWYRKHLWAEFRASFQMGLEIFMKIGNGASCRFWDDIWCGNQPFKLQFPRIYQLESVKDCFIAHRIGISDWIAVFRRPPRGGAETSQFNDLLSLIQDVVLSDSSDSWMWSVDASSGYTVASGRTLIDSNILDVAPKATRWNRLIPNKVNVFIWRLMLNKLPTRVNLDRRDIDVGSILCPICLEDIETVNHIFFSCNMAKDLWSMFAIWWDIDIPVCANVSEWFEWLDDLAVSNKVRSYIDGVGDSLMWHIWKFRNESIFSSSLPKKALIWDSIISHSFLWISSRNPKCNFCCGYWLQNPLTYTASL
ncbi:RNA-directed DNA polymerase, eukaryota, reverse transcriptase zinc-binding domain protein [Tanacetum coccineum]